MHNQPCDDTKSPIHGFRLSGYDVLREYCSHYNLDVIDTGMSYYVRDTPELTGVTPDDLAAFGARATEAAAALTQPRSVTELLDALDADAATRLALEARVEISAAVGADSIDASEVSFNVAPSESSTSWRIGGGNQRLAHALAAEIADRLVLAEPVTAVTAGDGRLTVATKSSSAAFDHVIVAVPFALLRNGSMHIDLPEWKHAALDRLVQGNAAKLHLPLNAIPPSSAVMSVVDRFWTWTAVDESARVAPVLNCFAGNLSSLITLGVEDGPQPWAARAQALRPDLDFADAAPTLTAWHLDPWAHGAYANHAPGFCAEDVAALQRPVGNVFFAGEYTSADKIGLMEGALCSGRRAAAEVLETIDRAAS